MIIFATFIIFPFSVALAQENLKPFDPSYKLYVRHDSTEYNGDTIVHNFSASLSMEYLPPLAGQLSDLVLSTTVGKIVFDKPFGGESDSSIVGKYVTDKYIYKFVITKATAKYNGSLVDLTENIRLSQTVIQPPIEITSNIYKNCPSKILDFTVRTGILKSSSGDDFIFAVIDFGNDKQEEYLCDLETLDIVQDESNFGKKIKFILKKKQYYGTNFSNGPVNEYCNKEIAITDIMLAE
jgi:hypothetical protein